MILEFSIVKPYPLFIIATEAVSVALASFTTELRIFNIIFG
jgi:hypothetical protein